MTDEVAKYFGVESRSKYQMEYRDSDDFSDMEVLSVLELPDNTELGYLHANNKWLFVKIMKLIVVWIYLDTYCCER